MTGPAGTTWPTESKLKFAAGQFAFFDFADMPVRESHPFTISSHPSADTLRVTIKALGDYTTELQTRLQIGSEVQVEGPYGHFTGKFANANDQLWFAGGIGITPFLAMVPEVESGKNIRLYWCIKNEEEATYTDELVRMAQENSGFSFELWPTDQKGRLSLEKIDHGQDLGNHDVLICGPDGLKKSLTDQLKNLGVRQRRIHDEEFSFR